MISFTDIKQALDHRQYCPFCDSSLTFNNEFMVEDFVWQGGEQKIAFYLSGGNNEDVLTINPHTNEVKIEVYGRDVTRHMYTGGRVKATIASNPNPFPRSGTLYQGLRAECEKCFLFSCTWQICIDLTDRKLTEVILNSERVSLEENGTVYEIISIYSIKQTHYTAHLADGSVKDEYIPLVPMDLKNPQETLGRIKRLLVFA